MTIQTKGNRRARAGFRVALVALIGTSLAGCDFEVTNPGPVQDVNLDDPATHDPMVNGAMRSVLTGFSSFAHYGGAVAREFQPSGGTGAAGIPRDIELGQLWDENTANSGWSRTHKGRWIAEYAIARIRETMGTQSDKYAPLGRAYLWAGVANKVLGENVCTAVFDGGKTEPYKTHFTRAIEQFTQAATIAAAAGDQTTQRAAIAFRAAAHAYLGNWQAAVTDASTIPVTFQFRAQYTGRGATDLGTDGETYRIVLAMSGTTYRSLSFRFTPWETYFPATGDPRAAWGFDNRNDEYRYGETPRTTFGSGAAARVFWYYPLKFYAPRNAAERTVFEKPAQDQRVLIPVNLATGREMLLIRAEAALVAGNVAGAMTLINQVRTTAADPRAPAAVGSYSTGQPLPPVTATTLEQAWTALKWERAIELLLEGRRLGDRRRWAENKTPGALNALEYVPDAQITRFASLGIKKEQDLCFPIPLGEKEANINIPDDFHDASPTGGTIW
jgi:starch-binding outer membrane protein, SusD/RagB family